MAGSKGDDSDDEFPNDFSCKTYIVKANIASKQSGETYKINLKTAKRVDYKKIFLNCIGQISSWYGEYDISEDGTQSKSFRAGTGTVIKKLPNNHFIVITCAHNLCSHSPVNNQLSFAKNVYFFPKGMKESEIKNRMNCVSKTIYTGYDPAKSVLCPNDLAIALFIDTKGAVVKHFSDIDVNAIITLNEFNDTVLCESCHHMFSLWGYPVQSNGQLQGENGGEATRSNTGFWQYDITTYPGQSGSALFKRKKRFSDLFGIYGIHVWGDIEKQENNCGILLNKEKLLWIKRECMKFEEIAKNYVPKPAKRVIVAKSRKVKVIYYEKGVKSKKRIVIWRTDTTEFTLHNLVILAKKESQLEEVILEYHDEAGNILIREADDLLDAYADHLNKLIIEVTKNEDFYANRDKEQTTEETEQSEEDDEKEPSDLYIRNPLIINIGISKYQYLPDLNGARKDIETIMDLFVNIYGYDMKLLIHNVDESEWSLEKGSILSTIMAARDKVEDIDSLIVILSGYGASGCLYTSEYNPQKGIDEGVGGIIGINDIQSLFVDGKFNVMPKIMIIDACGSGSDGKDEALSLEEKYDDLWNVMYSNTDGYKSFNGDDGGFLIRSVSKILRNERCRKQTKNKQGHPLPQYNLKKVMGLIRFDAQKLTKMKKKKDGVAVHIHAHTNEKMDVFFNEGTSKTI